MFVDERLPRMEDEALFRRLEPPGEPAVKPVLTPDAGIWKYRRRRRSAESMRRARCLSTNRVAVPSTDASRQAGGLAVAVNAAPSQSAS
jgi:hypothetical protein